MTLIRIVIVSAMIALLLMSAQTYAITRIIKPSGTPDRVPTVSILETLEYLQEQKIEPDVKIPGDPADDGAAEWSPRVPVD